MCVDCGVTTTSLATNRRSWSFIQPSAGPGRRNLGFVIVIIAVAAAAAVIIDCVLLFGFLSAHSSRTIRAILSMHIHVPQGTGDRARLIDIGDGRPRLRFIVCIGSLFF